MDRIRHVVLLATVLGCGFETADGGTAGLGESEGEGSTSSPASSAGSGMTAASASQGGVTTNGDSGSNTSTDGSTTGPITTTATTTGGGPAESSGEDTGSTGGSEACLEAGCDPNATCDDSVEPAVCTCSEGFFGDGTRCAAVELAMLRVELACLEQGICPLVGCAMQETAQDQAVLVGDPEVTYTVTLRFRGVIEEKTYSGGGPQDGYFHPNGTPASGGYNQFGLEVDDPVGTYFLNSGTSGGDRCWLLDETHDVEIRGEGVVRLFANNGFDVCGVRNRDGDGTPIVVEDIPPDPNPFDGQFIQIDVVGISAP